MDIPAPRSARPAISRALSPYLVLAQSRQVRVLFVGQVVAEFGNWLYVVSLVLVVYRLSHSANVVALITVALLVPGALMLPVSGVLADRLDRRTLMIVADVSRAVCMFGLLAVRSAETLPLAFVLVFTASSMATLFRPALSAVIPTVVDAADLPRTNALMRQIASIALVLGPAAGGVFVLAGHTRFAFVVTGGTALLSACSLALVRFPAVSVATRPADGQGWVHEFSQGFRFLFAHNQHVLGAFTLTIAGVTLLDGAFWTLVVVFPAQFHMGQSGTAFLNAAYGVGGLGGALLVSALAGRVRTTVLFITACAGSGVAAILWAMSPPGVAPYVTLALVGVADVTLLVAGTTIVQSATPDELMGRAFGAFESITVLSMVIGSAVVGPLVSALGPRVTTVVFAIVGLLLLVACTPTLRATEAVLGRRIFLRQVPVMNHLSLRTLDKLASRLNAERFEAGAALVRQGDRGDQLFVVRSGELDVLVQANAGPPVLVNTMAELEYVGEIALLHDVPRTATVVARTSVDVYALGRGDFEELVQHSGELKNELFATSTARMANTEKKLLKRL